MQVEASRGLQHPVKLHQGLGHHHQVGGKVVLAKEMHQEVYELGQTAVPFQEAG